MNKLLFQLKELFLDDSIKKVDNEFYKYYRIFFNDSYHLHQRLIAMEKVFDITCANEKVIIEAGCGFGLNSIIMALLGAGKVFRVDENDD